jgi:hypothetical protein
VFANKRDAATKIMVPVPYNYFPTGHLAISFHSLYPKHPDLQLLSLSIMKPHKSAPSSPKRSAAIATPIIILLVLSLVSIYELTFSNTYPRIARAVVSSSSASLPSLANVTTKPPWACNVTRGEWVPDAEPPYYTNLTCPFIDDHQNCMKFGKPSLEFMRWRWRPHGCDLPRFDAARFLEAMRGKSVAFVGDSLARNHFKSLLCLLSQVRPPLH